MSNAAPPDPSHASKPWLERADWAAGRVKPSGGSWSVIIAIAIFWNAFCIGVGYFAYPHLRVQVAAGEYLFLLLLVFPLIGVGLAINAVRSTIHGRRLGRMWLELKTVPAPVGQFLGGVLHSDKELDMKQGVRLTLKCFKETLSIGMRRRQRVQQLRVTPEWSDTQVLGRELLEHDRNRTALPVYFKLPRDVPGTQKRVGPVGYYWQLEVTFDKAARANLVSGVHFDVPVFKTAASDELFAGPATHDPAAEFKSDAPLAETPEAQGMRVSHSRRGGTVFTFQAPDAIRGAGCTIGALVLALIAGYATWHLWTAQRSIQGALFAAFVCFLFLLFLNYMWFHVNRLTLDVGEAEYEHTLFGLGVRKKFDPALIASVEPERDKNEAREVLWDVPLVLLEQKPDGLAYKKRHMLIRGLARETADAIATQLRTAVAHAVAGKKREFRVASGTDPAVIQRQVWLATRISKTVSAVAMAAVAFIAFQVLYVDYAKKRKTEPYRFAMATLNANVAARDALGPPISPGWFAHGAVNDYGPDTGWATLDIPVSGSRGRGRLHVQGNKKAGAWEYSRVAVNVPGAEDEIELVPSAATSP